MTSDIVQNRFIAKSQASGHEKRSFLPSTKEFFNIFTKEESNLPQSDMQDLLKTAYKMLEQADKDLVEKDRRIQKLENILTIDELTGLTNRRGFFQAFKREIDRTNRGENNGGLFIMIDLDYFKTINDTFGHRAGDAALKAVGNFLNNQVRDMDVAARIGGDEFIILFPNTSITKAMKRAHKLGKELNKLRLEWEGATINIHASLGLKEYKTGQTIESIIEDADKSMYQNKEEKRRALH